MAFKKGNIPWNLGKKLGPLSDEQKQKLSKALIGRKFSIEHLKNLKESRKGRIISPETRKKMGEAIRGRVMSDEWKKKLVESRKDYKHSEETKRKIGNARKGAKSHFWKGGITPKNLLIRQSIEYDLWKDSVFTRDDYTCRDCGQRGGILHAHHIKPFAYYPDVRFAIDNGETLCKKCHRGRHALRKVN